MESCINYDIVIWWANVSNDLPKIRNVKEINYKTMFVSSKRNIDNKYSFEDLLQRSLSLKSNLAIEFTKAGQLYNMRLFDPLGNVWYEGTNIKECSKEMLSRLHFIKSITRQSTIQLKKMLELWHIFLICLKKKCIAHQIILLFQLKKNSLIL